MGNVIQCCHTLSNYFKCKDASAQGGAERSPLLSSEGSECDSPTLPDDLEDDMLSISTGETNLALEPEHFLFPDLILSSNLGGDMALVEPMVCLLVSEEEEGGGEGRRVDELGGEGEEGPDEWGGRRYSEVETQTEVETQMVMGVQTQTESQAEVQTQTERLMFSNEAPEREIHTQTNRSFVCEDHGGLKEVDVLLEAQASSEKYLDFQTVTKIHSERQKNPLNPEMLCSEKLQEDEESEQEKLKKDQICSSFTTHLFQEEQNTCLKESLNIDKEQHSTFASQGHVDLTEHCTLPTQENVMEREEHTGNQTDERVLLQEEDLMAQERNCDKCERSELEPDECCTDLTKHQDNEPMEQTTVVSEQNAKNEDDSVHTKTKCKQCDDHTDEMEASPHPHQKDDYIGYNTDQMQGNIDQSVVCVDQIDSQENTYPPKRGNNKTSQQCVVDLGTALLQKEDAGPGPKQMTLFLVDRLFLEAPHVKAPPHQTEENSDSDSPEQSDTDKINQLSIRDIVELQETGFSVKIQPPGADGFELQVSGQMLVAELHQVLMDHEITCHRTCFSLQLGGSVLDSLTELRCVQGLQDGAVIKVVEGSYSIRDARLHLRHVRDLLRSLDPTDAYNGLNGSSLSYFNFFTQGDKDCESVGKGRAPERGCTDCSPPEYVLPGCKDRPLTPLQPVRDDWKPLQCLRVLTMSSWNPPPGNRKMHGDLMYLNVLTMEDKELNITSSTRGFYINQSTAFNFNPKPAVPRSLCHSLVELLSQVSPAFRKNYNMLQKKRVQQHPYERIATSFQLFTWTAPQGDHILDGVRAEETHTSRMGQDEHTAGQSRDWNEELQGSRELPKDSLQERLHRERSIFKIFPERLKKSFIQQVVTNSDFTCAATRGAVAVVDGNVVPLNPGEAPHLQMFIWNNIFFSLGFDISEHYSPLGGNAAAHSAAICDLRGVQAYASVDIKGLHTLGTAVIDYRGIRVIAQTIVPGLLEKNQEQTVVYGSNDYGETVYTHPRFLELLNKTCQPLKIQRHQVLDHDNSPVDLCSGIETKGILGNDGRPYILDLLRTSPPDLNMQILVTKEVEEEVPTVCQQFGYPLRSGHRLASLRPELIDAFIQHRYELYVNMVSKGLRELEGCPDRQQMAAESAERFEDETTELRDVGEDRPGDKTTADLWKKSVIAEACKAVGSVSDSCFDIRFNPDVCSPGVRFPSECTEEVQRQKQLLWDAAAFLLSNQIPAVLKDCLDYTVVPMDGMTLTSVLHQRGVNVRYLGTLLKQLDKLEERGRLSHVQRISISEVIIRSAKHIFRNYLQDVEPAAFSAAVSHFLNCLLSSSSSGFLESCSDELLIRRRSRRRRSHGSRVALLTETVWAKLTSSELWSRIRTEAEDYYHCSIQSGNIDEVIETHSLQRISLLREISIKTGIQVQLREYAFESRHRPVFAEEDIVNMFPVVKHLKPTATDASQLVQQAQEAVQQGLLKDGYELISQAMTLFSSICGVLHEDVSTCLRLLGRLSYILGDYADALSHQEKTVMSSERVQGIDHPQTIQDYTHLALYCFAGGRHSTSLQLLYRARYLTLLVCGEDHPQVALLDSMLGLVLHGLMEYELSQKFLQNALILTSKYHGALSLKHAHSHHLLATMLESKGEFRSALQHEKEAFSIYKRQVGDSHDKTKESSEYLKSLTQQAVILQKVINQIYSNTPGACVPPPKFTSPNLATILQQLNLTCGIILIPLSAKEVADLRMEFQGKEKVQVEELEKQLLKQKHLTSADNGEQH